MSVATAEAPSTETDLQHSGSPQRAADYARRYTAITQTSIDSKIAEMLRSELGEAMDVWEAEPRQTNNLRINGSNGQVQAKIKGVYTKVAEIAPYRTRSAIYEIADLLGVQINDQYPIFSGEFPLDNSRIQIVLERACDNPIIVWRRPADVAKSFEELADEDVFTRSQVEFINERWEGRQNFILAGATDSGKTYNCHGFMHLFARHPERFLLLLEDAKEIKQLSDNVERLYARRGFGRAPDIQMHDLVEMALRMDPDIIAMGEMRSPFAASAYYEALNTGHSGSFVTFHSNSAKDALRRYQWLLMKAGINPVPEEIASTFNVVIFCRQIAPDVRKAVEVAEVSGYRDGQYQLRHVA